jgi:hypothetical protein
MKISHCSKWWNFAKYDEVFSQNKCRKIVTDTKKIQVLELSQGHNEENESEKM